MALKKVVKAITIAGIAISSALATNFADNKAEMTAAANEKDAAMELKWQDLQQQHDDGKLSKEAVVSAMQPHVEELADLERKERGAVAGMVLAGMGMVASGSVLLFGDKKKPKGNTNG